MSIAIAHAVKQSKADIEALKAQVADLLTEAIELRNRIESLESRRPVGRPRKGDDGPIDGSRETSVGDRLGP